MRICFVQQHPVDEQKIPAAILRWVTLLDKFRDAGHSVFAIGPNNRLKFEEREFRGVRQLLIPTPGTGIKSLDMLFFAAFLFPGMLIARKKFRIERWFVDELFVCFGILFYRLFHPRDIICYDVMGIHYYQVKKNNRKLVRHFFLANLYGIMEYLTLFASSFVTTINLAHAEILREWSSKPCHVIRDAVDFSSATEKIADELVLPKKRPGDIFLTFVGKISNNRLDELYAILLELMQRIPQLKFIIIGDGPFTEKYKSWSVKLGLSERIIFVGFVPHSHLPTHIGQADISYSDDWSDIGFPMKVFEYMAMGSAILVEKTPAVSELMADSYNCILYHGKQELLDSVIKLCNDADLRTRIGEVAKVEAIEYHNWDDRLARFENLYAYYAGEIGSELIEKKDLGYKN